MNSNVCSVCKYTYTLRSILRCPRPGCRTSVCRGCRDAWAESKMVHPKCPGCDAQWTKKELIKMCTKSWYNRVFKRAIGKK